MPVMKREVRLESIVCLYYFPAWLIAELANNSLEDDTLQAVMVVRRSDHNIADSLYGDKRRARVSHTLRWCSSTSKNDWKRRMHVAVQKLKTRPHPEGSIHDRTESRPTSQEGSARANYSATHHLFKMALW